MKIKSLLENLRDKTVRELNAVARKYGLSGYSKLDKKDLVKFVRGKLKALVSGKAKPKKKVVKKEKNRGRPSIKKRSRAAKTAEAQKKTPAKKMTRGKAEKKSPKRTGEGVMVLLPRDDEWLYVYWDLTVQQEKLLRSSGVPTLRLLGHPDRRELKRIPLSQGARSWHMQAGTADRDYIAELGVVDWRGVFRPLLASNPASTPPDEVSGNLQAVFGEFQPDGSPQPHPGPPGADLKKAERFGKLSHGKETGTGSASSDDVLRRK